jgi:hypothetical protein
MSELNRRTFMKFLGQGSAIFGIGLSSRGLWAQTKGSSQPETKVASTTKGGSVKYQVFQPGKYFDWEKKAIEERFASAKKGPQKAASAAANIISEADIVKYNSTWDPYNPLFNDKAYAQKAGYPNIPAFPAFQGPSGESVSGIPRDLGDSWYFANDGGRMEFYTPIFAGDSLTSQTEKLIFEELTLAGSDLRMFLDGGTSSARNQKGELVVRNTGTTRQAYRKIIDGSQKISFTENMSEWTKDFPKGHYTTDEEWAYIQELWKKETIRGSQKLYWEDVKVGDQPTWTCSGPIGYMDIIGWNGGGQKGLAWRNKMEETKTEFRDQYGNYLPLQSMHYGGRNIPGSRMVFYNSTAANHIIRMVTNYIGDAGFVTKYHWHFKQLFKEMQVARFQGGEYLDLVPSMKGKTCTLHGSEGDTVIAKGYVTKKYKNEKGEGIIDITCWGETLDNRIIQIVAASAKLPLKK